MEPFSMCIYTAQLLIMYSVIAEYCRSCLSTDVNHRHFGVLQIEFDVQVPPVAAETVFVAASAKVTCFRA